MPPERSQCQNLKVSSKRLLKHGILIVRTHRTFDNKSLTRDTSVNLYNNNLSKLVPWADRKEPDTSVCHQGAHENVLSDIHDWAKDFSKPPIYWLPTEQYGTDKSTISRTVVDMLRDKLPILPFYCSRAEEDTPKSIFPALGVKFARRHSQQAVEQLSKRIASMLDCNLDAQMKGLIIEPLQDFGAPGSGPGVVFIIDALGECKEDPVSSILTALSMKKSEMGRLSLKFFITSGSITQVTRRLIRSATVGSGFITGFDLDHQRRIDDWNLHLVEARSKR